MVLRCPQGTPWVRSTFLPKAPKISALMAFRAALSIRSMSLHRRSCEPQTSSEGRSESQCCGCAVASDAHLVAAAVIQGAEIVHLRRPPSSIGTPWSAQPDVESRACTQTPTGKRRRCNRFGPRWSRCRTVRPAPCPAVDSRVPRRPGIRLHVDVGGVVAVNVSYHRSSQPPLGMLRLNTTCTAGPRAAPTPGSPKDLSRTNRSVWQQEWGDPAPACVRRRSRPCRRRRRGQAGSVRPRRRCRVRPRRCGPARSALGGVLTGTAPGRRGLRSRS